MVFQQCSNTCNWSCSSYIRGVWSTYIFDFFLTCNNLSQRDKVRKVCKEFKFVIDLFVMAGKHYLITVYSYVIAWIVICKDDPSWQDNTGWVGKNISSWWLLDENKLSPLSLSAFNFFFQVSYLKTWSLQWFH